MPSSDLNLDVRIKKFFKKTVKIRPKILTVFCAQVEIGTELGKNVITRILRIKFCIGSIYQNFHFLPLKKSQKSQKFGRFLAKNSFLKAFFQLFFFPEFLELNSASDALGDIRHKLILKSTIFRALRAIGSLTPHFSIITSNARILRIKFWPRIRENFSWCFGTFFCCFAPDHT